MNNLLWIPASRAGMATRITIVFFCLFLTYNACQASDLSLDEISESNSQNIERDDLPTLADKQKESIAAEQTTEPLDSGPLLYKSKAKIIILNKITAKSELIEFKLGETKYFGNLSVEIQKCVKNTDPLNSSNLMLVSVFDNKPDDDRVSVFQGWMDSANLSISTVEHPIYEIIPKECID